jgi:hypothetical protein
MKYNNTFREALEKVREAPDHEISMARGELKATADKALELVAALEGKSDEGNPMEAWVQSKITKAKDYVNSVYDYLMYNPNVANEEVKPEEDKPKDDEKEKSDSKDEVQRLKNEIQMLKISLENEKNKTIKPEPNPDTGEVPLRTGVAQAMLDKTTPMPKVQPKVKTLFKKSLGKTKIEVNPDVNIGVYSGGKNTGSGQNLN